MPRLVLHSSHPKLVYLVREGCQKMAHKPRLQGFGILVLCVLLGPAMIAAQQPALSLIPAPANVQVGSSSLRVDSSFTIALAGHSEPRLDRAVERFLRQLALQTALPLSPKPARNSNATLLIQTEHAGKEIQEVGEDESYVLEVSAMGATLTAPTPLGTMHG